MSDESAAAPAPPSTEGGCLCGAVRFRVRSAPLFVGSCYCTDCQRRSGAGHATVVGVPEDAVELRGELAHFSSRADSGTQVSRAFCPTCGSPVHTQSASAPGVTLINAGALDASDHLQVQAALYVGSARAWDPPPADIPRYAEMPPR